MAVYKIDADLLKKMFLSGANNLDLNKEWINELNVFPVPDGDTGTNMTMTIMSAAREVQAIEQPTLENLAKAISSGSLRGARGNSGVILSQLLRGFTKAIKKQDAIDVPLMADAFQKAVETAYKAVMKPKEGTILTVAKGMADKAIELREEIDDLDEALRQIIEYGDKVLAHTPELLPVLKEAGVVDSGGQGLMQAMKGAYSAMTGKEIAPAQGGEALSAGSGAGETGSREAFEGQGQSGLTDFDIKFGYCTEFIINLEKEMEDSEEQAFKQYLESIGDSIVLVADEEIVKVHVHTNDPGLAIQKALTYGSLSRMKIDNMREEHQEKLIKDASRLAAEQKAAEETRTAEKPTEPRKPYGFVAVSVGEGMDAIFRDLGVDCLITGGQTMNPSTEDMLNAINQVNADTVFVLPNNKNIILAAQQAQSLTEDKEVIVVPTKTVPQGISAIIGFSPDRSAEENAREMEEELSLVKTGQVTYAVRDTAIDGKEIHAGDIMGLDDHTIAAVGNDVTGTALELLSSMVDEDSELITIYYGSDLEEGDAQAFYEKVQEAYPACDVELQNGGQPIYYYVISVE
ncbi:MAG: DAK2 domain-containing protein [Lachnospiraceae bacterium]|nr:DAK2 domain-containing protein [Lachnospiraceae bacterium]